MTRKHFFRTGIGFGVALAIVIACGPLASAGAPGRPTTSAKPAAAPHAFTAPRAVPHAVHQAPTLETHFVPITPCRVADTRGGSPLAHGHTRNFYVAGTFGFPSQGGHNNGCDVPVDASSIAMTVTALNETGGGALTIFPAGSSRPLSRSLSFSKGVAITASSDLSIRPGGSPHLSVYNTAASGSTDLLLDVDGYFVDQIDALVYTGGGAAGVYAGSPRVLSVTNLAPGQARVTLDRDVTYCAISASSYFGEGVYANALGFATNTVTVYTWYLNSTTHQETYANNYAYLTITC